MPAEAAIYPAEVDARPHPGGQRTLLCANIFEYWRSTMAERFEIVEKALLKMLDEKKYASLRDILVTMNPSDVAGLFDGLEEKQIPVMFRSLPKEQAAETFVEMEPEAQQLLIQGRVEEAGLAIIEARITYLAYAPEIAAVMLQRQQASAIIDARKMIVDGAVGMVEMALERLEEKDTIALDDERKAAMVSNLLVVLCGNHDAQPIVNTGSLY